MNIFVFGSNLAGIHGAGAAKTAMLQYGASYGQGQGLQGLSYAIPTKDYNIKTLPLGLIKVYVEKFKEFARNFSEHKLIVTRIGCGLAGYTDSDIAPMFVGSPANCYMPPEWVEYTGGETWHLTELSPL